MKAQHGLGRTGEGALGTLIIGRRVIIGNLRRCLTFHLQMDSQLLVEMEARPTEMTLRQQRSVLKLQVP